MTIGNKEMFIGEDEKFHFELDEKEVKKLLNEKWAIVKGFFPFICKKKCQDCFYAGYREGYDEAYNDAFVYLVEKLGMNSETQNKEEKFEYLKQCLKDRE